MYVESETNILGWARFDLTRQIETNLHIYIVVLSSDFVGVFCLPNSTESEKNFYVIRDQKALESVQKY